MNNEKLLRTSRASKVSIKGIVYDVFGTSNIGVSSFGSSSKEYDRT